MANAWLAAALLLGALPAAAPAAERTSVRDPQDGAFDLSAVLDTAYGFVPIAAPITEPAVGYGAAAALVFIDRNAAADGRPLRPNIAMLGGIATENGTRGAFGGHVGHWREGRVRTVVALADLDVNLEFFGLGESAGDDGVEYTIAARGGVAGASRQVGRHPVWVGLRYAQATTDVSLPGADDSAFDPDDLHLRLAAVTPTVTYDSRDNPFTPTRGLYLDLAAPLAREALGSDRDFELYKLGAQYYRPLGERLQFGTRAGYRASSDGTPFFLRPYVTLRGVQAMQYQGERVAELETELRWQWRPRYGAVAFGGLGRADGDRGEARDVGAGGFGVRYLVARTYGLHLGVDVAWGPDEPVFYVIFGSAWMRP